MRIRARLSLIFVLLIVAGVTAIASFAILVIRKDLQARGRQQMAHDARAVAAALQFVPDSLQASFFTSRAALQTYSYAVWEFPSQRVLYRSGASAAVQPPGPDTLRQIGYQPFVFYRENFGAVNAWIRLPDRQQPRRTRLLVLSQPRKQHDAVVKQIRWIIYTGMLISIVLVILVSTRVAASLSRPIQQLTQLAKRIAGGEHGLEIALKRKDEFGELAQALNQMAARFRQDNAELQRLYERQQRFFADITHEIRNPLHTAMGALEMLELENLTEKERTEWLHTSLSQLERMQQLAEDMQTLQKSDFDPHFVQPQPLEVRSVLEASWPPYARTAEEKGLDFIVNLAPGSVFADAQRLQQVVENLLSNAVKYTQQGHIKLTGGWEKHGYRVTVADTGPGIAEAHHPYLFDRFYRLETDRSRQTGGTGLGLAVVKRILEAHQTGIELESTPGKGSRFSFVLLPAGQPN